MQNCEFLQNKLEFNSRADKINQSDIIFRKITLFLNGSILNGREPWLVDDFSSVISSPKFDFWPKFL